MQIICCENFMSFLLTHSDCIADQPGRNLCVKYSRFSGHFMAFLYYFLYAEAMVFASATIFKPTSPELWSSLVFTERSSGCWLQLLPFALLQYYFVLSYTDMVLLYTFYSFAFLFPALDILDSLL